MLFRQQKAADRLAVGKAPRQAHRHLLRLLAWRFTGSLFRRHVAGCAQHFQRARDSAFRLYQSSETKVGKVRFALLIEQNVSWL